MYQVYSSTRSFMRAARERRDLSIKTSSSLVVERVSLLPPHLEALQECRKYATCAHGTPLGTCRMRHRIKRVENHAEVPALSVPVTLMDDL